MLAPFSMLQQLRVDIQRKPTEMKRSEWPQIWLSASFWHNSGNPAHMSEEQVQVVKTCSEGTKSRKLSSFPQGDHQKVQWPYWIKYISSNFKNFKS